MPLDPQASAYLDQMAAVMPPLDTLTPDVIRAAIQAQVAQAAEQGAPEPVAQVNDRAIPGPAGEIPVRVYTPEGDGPFPLLVYVHGGGWVICTLDTHDGLCRSLANQAGCVVVSVDYRLAPERPFPAAPEDCYAATRWVAAHATTLNGDAMRVAVGGDSAGGNLAAVVALLARERGGPPLVFQLLIYPATDLRMGSSSIEENAEGYGLTKRDMLWFRGHYLRSTADATDPLASPLLAPDLRGVPPALIITAEYDPLRDEGERYGARLREAGVPVTISRYDGMIHGFTGMGAVMDQGTRSVAECAHALRAAYA